MRTANTVDIIVVGGGQAGLAMSRCLTGHAVDHVVLERGEVANSWRTERWDSLRLLTPNWLSRLPGWSYRGADPHGYMTVAELIDHLDRYGRSFGAPVRTGARVTAVSSTGDGFRVRTAGAGEWRARCVVLASGACSDPHRPLLAGSFAPRVVQRTAISYRNPAALPDGAALVVGASASGVQIADELARSGRQVTLAVGEHVRVPRTYRGRDIHWWLDEVGVLGERAAGLVDLERARRVPSLQLMGSPERRAVDLNALSELGVRLVGRLAAVRDGRALCSGGLANLCTSADLKQRRLLDRLDAHATLTGLDDDLAAPHRPEPTRLPPSSLEVDVRSITTVVWATGFRPRYPWLDPRLAAAATDRRGRLLHDGGVLPVPGLVVLGLPLLRRRKSTLIDGVGLDAADLAARLRSYLDGGAWQPRPSDQRR